MDKIRPCSSKDDCKAKIQKNLEENGQSTPHSDKYAADDTDTASGTNDGARFSDTETLNKTKTTGTLDYSSLDGNKRDCDRKNDTL